ncbi:MAG: amidohydrolase family protein [Gammaproteobacteria bacterium]
MSKTYLRGARLIDGVNKPANNKTIVLEGERIAAISSTAKARPPAPEDTVIDLDGKVVMPGMTFGHYHPAYNNVDTAGQIDLEHPPTMLTLIAARNAETLLHCGYTSSIGAGAGSYIDVVLRDAVNAGLISGPRIFACGRDVVTTGDSVDAHPKWWNLEFESFAKLCDGPDEFRRAVREEVANGVDIVKIYPTGGHGLPTDREMMSMGEDELDIAIRTAHERGVKIRGHLISKRGILASLKAGIDIVDHGDGTDEECIEWFLKQGSYMAPSLYLPSRMVGAYMSGEAPELEPLIPDLEITLENHPEQVRKAHEAGVPLLVGDDFGFSRYLPHGDYAKELAVYPELCGVSNLDVIGWATRNGAAFTGRLDELGTVEQGKLADLLIIDGDPSKDLRVLAERSNIKAVIKNGEFVTCTLAATPVPETA